MERARRRKREGGMRRKEGERGRRKKRRGRKEEKEGRRKGWGKESISFRQSEFCLRMSSTPPPRMENKGCR